jgi:hypothetical protein
MEKKTISTHEFSEYEDQFQVFGIISLSLFISAILIPTKKKTSDNFADKT